MSCITAIQPRMTRAQIREAARQRFAYTSPPLRPSLMQRLNVLAHEAHPKLRESAALSYHLPAHLQLMLSADRDAGVRRCLARNPHVQGDTIRILATDEDDTVRGFAVLNKNVPQDVVELLLEDENEMVRALAAWVDSPAFRD